MAYYWEPFSDIVFLEVKSQISNSMRDSDLATAYANVSNKLSGIMHELDDPDFDAVHDKVEQSFAMWLDLEEVLYDLIVAILRSENETGSHHVLSGIGTHYIVQPFMERNGFRDGCGWWIKKESDC